LSYGFIIFWLITITTEEVQVMFQIDTFLIWGCLQKIQFESRNFRTSKDGNLACFTMLYRIRSRITETLLDANGTKCKHASKHTQNHCFLQNEVSTWLIPHQLIYIALCFNRINKSFIKVEAEKLCNTAVWIYFISNRWFNSKRELRSRCTMGEMFASLLRQACNYWNLNLDFHDSNYVTYCIFWAIKGNRVYDAFLLLWSITQF
jgi:hypothetical protein